MQRPVGIAEHLAGEEDQIGLTLADDCIGLMRVGDHADGRGGNCGFGADARGKRSLETGTGRDFGVRNQASGRDVDEVDAMSAEEACESDRVIWRPAALSPIRRRDADEEGEVGRPNCADCVDDLKQEARAVFEAAAVGIRAVIGERRQELMEQIAVGSVDLNEVEACSVGALCRPCESRDDGVDAGLVECLRGGVVRGDGDCARGDGLPAPFGG